MSQVIKSSSVLITWEMLEKLLQVTSSKETTCSGSILIAYTDDEVKRLPFRDLHHHDLGTLIAINQHSPKTSVK